MEALALPFFAFYGVFWYSLNMSVITIPKKLTEKGDLVIIPRQEYERLLGLKKVFPVVKPSKEEMRAIRRGEREIAKGEYITLEQLKRELERSRN